MRAEDDLAAAMKRIANMGVTISVNRAPGSAFRDPSPTDEIVRAAPRQGIYEKKG
ncbi:hypothetical protein [Leucobacter luti]|uniref:hypothetical protein n=1 Tax=Leucobacter luti TaxID=340320 RepID=UPI001C68E325|nr:hypothetical protein [Leucobacter luti]QYM75593.1 hypothetical protein K1X41_13375 [Leucobacter luti]